MAGKIQALFNQYQQKYQLYTKDDILDLMVKDGAITLEMAKKIKSGVCLFCLENKFANPNNNNDISMKEIFGGDFSPKTASKIRPDTNFNRSIEPTFQSEKQGDCWLLSDVNALNQTEWGKKAIYEAIIPDTDGKGGVTIKFKGSPLSQKDFYISGKELEKARKKGKYSSGDDDMIAFELATEKVIKELVKTGKGTRIEDFDKELGYKSYLTGVVTGNKVNKYLSISTLITGQEVVHIDFLLRDETKGEKIVNPTSILKHLAQREGKNAIRCTFDHLKDISGTRAEDDPVHGSHAYAIKEIDFGKFVIVIDPYYSDKEIKLSWEKFIDDVEGLFVAPKNNEERQSVINALPKNYEKLKNKISKEREATVNAIYENIKNIEKNYIQEQIYMKVQKILKDDDWNFLDTRNEFAYKNILHIMNEIDKDIVLEILDKKPDLVLKLDKYKSGWGSGSEKKALISPIINALAEKAEEKGINSKTIQDFKTKCNKELNAMFYTDEKVLQGEVEKMVKLLNSK